MNCPTVRIKSTAPEEQGLYVVINEEDFDAGRHELYVEGAPAEPGVPVDNTPDEPDAPAKGRRGNHK